MGFDYALVHLKYTIPPAIALTFIFRPLSTRLDLYKVLFLIGVAVVATIPWDSYLIRCQIWTYPPRVILGPTLFSIPAEEVFFFVIQTYSTSLLYLLLSKPVLKPAYLVGNQSGHGQLLKRLRRLRTGGQAILISIIVLGVVLLGRGGEGTYLGLILTWAGPFALLLWTLAYQFLGTLSYMNTLLPIVLPTLYLWCVDTLALKRGTWSIESGTKLGIYVWPNLEIEEAIFFLATNALIVLGLLAFENAMAILETFPSLFPDLPTLPSPVLLVRALLIDPAKYDSERILGIQESMARLRGKSRSFYLASSVFSGRLRIDLILLYSFCRVADDLVDNATSKSSACSWISKLSDFLTTAYSTPKAAEPATKRNNDLISIINEFPPSARSALLLLPTHLISSKPLYDLLSGFQTDLEFPGHNTPEPTTSTISSSHPPPAFPLMNESDLELYATRVAGTVAELCLELVFHHSDNSSSSTQPSVATRQLLIRSGARMGIALQYVNIARDIAVDASIGRVYLPTTWLLASGLSSPLDVLAQPSGAVVERLRTKLLRKAFGVYEEAKGAMALLPLEGRAPMRVAVESYMEIGRVLAGEEGYEVKAGRATVPKMRRIRVAWKALNES